MKIFFYILLFTFLIEFNIDHFSAGNFEAYLNDHDWVFYLLDILVIIVVALNINNGYYHRKAKKINDRKDLLNGK